jgi:adenine-specific DNA-methyltransferase
MGPGAFIASLREQGVRKSRIVGIDIDRKAGDEDGSAITLRGIDFFKWCASTTKRFDRIVANPPYVAIRKLHPTLQRALHSYGSAEDRSFALRSNYWCAFLSASIGVLEQHGSLAFVLPAAWDYAHYASDVKRTIDTDFQHVEVHRSQKPLFPGVKEGCVVLVAKGYRKRPKRSVRVAHDSGEALIEALTGVNSKACLPVVYQNTADQSLTAFADLFEVKIGCVTGDARYFLLRESERLKLGLPLACVSPVLSKARHLTSSFMSSRAWDRLLKADERIWLFRPEGRRMLKHKAVQSYLRYGRKVCDLEACKLSIRDAWYRVDDIRYGATGFISGMTKIGPWICFRSKRDLFVTNTLYSLSEKNKMSLHERSAWGLSLISTTPRLQFRLIARHYPDGLAKLEPHDLNSIRLPKPLRTKGAADAYERAIKLLLAGRETDAVAIADRFTSKR